MSIAEPAPVFIVGAPRSGTTLLAALLAGHSRIACGPETQFFSKLDPGTLRQAVTDAEWPRKAVTLVTSLTLSGQRVHELFGLSEADITRYLEGRTPGEAAMLESLTAQFAAQEGKPRWAEKTPNHLLHLQQIRSLYPESAIIRIVRDPRDAALSLCKLPWASHRTVVNCFLWNDWFERSRAFFDTDSRSMTVLYEQLVERPGATMGELCRFVGETFEPGMLNTAAAGAKLISKAEPWKDRALESIDRSRIGVWRRACGERERLAATVICHEGIGRFGYEAGEVRAVEDRFVWRLRRRDIEAHYPLILEKAIDRWRVSPTDDPWLGTPVVFLPSGPAPPAQHARRVLKLAWILAGRRWSGRASLYWRETLGHDRTTVGRIEAWILRSLAAPDEADHAARPPRRFASGATGICS